MVLHRCRGEREKGHDSALAPVVGAHDEDHVLEPHHDHERPEDRRHATEHVRWGERNPMFRIEGLLGGVKRAGADVAIDDAERGKSQACERLFFIRIALQHPSSPPESKALYATTAMSEWRQTIGNWMILTNWRNRAKEAYPWQNMCTS